MSPPWKSNKQPLRRVYGRMDGQRCFGVTSFGVAADTNSEPPFLFDDNTNNPHRNRANECEQKSENRLNVLANFSIITHALESTQNRTSEKQKPTLCVCVCMLRLHDKRNVYLVTYAPSHRLRKPTIESMLSIWGYAVCACMCMGTLCCSVAVFRSLHFVVVFAGYYKQKNQRFISNVLRSTSPLDFRLR